MAKQAKLERLNIPPSCRVVKDWFPTRESAQDALPAILAHIKTTGQTHTCFCHTHTKPPADAVPVYLSEFVLPDRYRKAKRYCPCPCCWDEVGKFGHGRIAWFADERVIRIIGEDCFAALNPEGHRHATDQFDLEQKRKRDRDFLLANVGRLPDVLAIVNRAIVVARAVENLHTLLHNRFRMVGLKLWPYVRRNGELQINVKEEEFRRQGDGEMYAHEVHGTRTFAVVPGYEMLNPDAPRLSGSLEGSAGRIRQYRFGEDWKAAIEALSDEERHQVADTLSRAVGKATACIAELENLRRFIEPVAINTLRSWGAHEGCPIPYIYSHNGTSITFGPSDYQSVGVPLSAELQTHIGQIEFWTPRAPKRPR